MFWDKYILSTSVFGMLTLCSAFSTRPRIRVVCRSFLSLNLVPGSTEPYTHKQQTVFPYVELLYHYLLHADHQDTSFTQQQLYNVVSDIDSYQFFVPYCNKSHILRRLTKSNDAESAIILEAELQAGFLTFKESYVSRVTCRPFSSVEAVARSSTTLFKELTTKWQFEPVHQSLSTRPETLVTFDLTFAFDNPLYAAVASSYFNTVSGQTVQAFRKRCEEVYSQTTNSEL